jgi:hypothetical protein
MLVAVCSDKGSPGATTTGLALASAWPAPATLVETDPYGGDLAIRLRTDKGATLPEAPTVLTVATAARTSTSGSLVARYAQRVNNQVSLVPGHLVAEQLSGVADWEPLAAALATSTTPMIVDLGRLHGSSPVLGVAAAADVVLVVGRPDAGSVIRMRERVNRLVPAVAALRRSPPRIVPVLVSAHRHGPADVADLRAIFAETRCGPMIALAGFIAFDPAAVSRLEAGESPNGRLARTPLLRSARGLAGDLAKLIAPGVVGEAEPAVPEVGP